MKKEKGGCFMANKRKFLSAVLAFVLTFSILPGSLNVYAENQG